MLNKPKGNMYEFVDYTWNPIHGKCSHACTYCYMNGWNIDFKPKMKNTWFRDDLGNNNFIFVGSAIDLFAEDIPRSWILRVLKYCNKFPDNRYLFQSKNPKRFIELLEYFPANVMFCTTLESNAYHECMGNSPFPYERSLCMKYLSRKGFDTMITVEPVLDFALREFVSMIKSTEPSWIAIGADSKDNNLREPSEDKLHLLIQRLTKEGIKVYSKNNLLRILK